MKRMSGGVCNPDTKKDENDNPCEVSESSLLGKLQNGIDEAKETVANAATEVTEAATRLIGPGQQGGRKMRMRSVRRSRSRSRRKSRSRNGGSHHKTKSRGKGRSRSKSRSRNGGKSKKARLARKGGKKD
jgi:hypothetical protein